MKKVLVIGYGNTLRGDDAVGIKAAELISKRHPEIFCVCMHQLMPEMAEQISECDMVFFIDADIDVLQSEARLIEPVFETEQPRTHFISPESLLSLSRQLYQRVPEKTYVVGIPASKFEFSEELTETAIRGMDDCVKVVERLIDL